jgi:hypothetical protein
MFHKFISGRRLSRDKKKEVGIEEWDMEQIGATE